MLLPPDQPGVDAGGALDAAVVSATCATNERLLPLWRSARERARCLLVDPRSAAFQFEGYVSMEDVRSLPYSPGQGTLGGIWQAGGFRRDRRAELIREAFTLQRHLEADLALAPYFFVPDPGHDWLGVAIDTAIESRDAAGDLPLGVGVLVDIDTLLRDSVQPTLAEAFGACAADLFVVTVIDFDEIKASPEEVRAVIDFLGRLQRHAPAMLWHTGRAGLAAIARGAAGYAGGVLELETHPRRYLREGMINLHANAHYLPGIMLRLPVRDAAAVAAEEPDADRDGAPAATRLVQRERVRLALDSKNAEIAALAALPAGDRAAALASRFDSAYRLCDAVRDRTTDAGGPALTLSQYHYLEVLREICGGEPATVLLDPGF
jgi:hypothetical protein